MYKYCGAAVVGCVCVSHTLIFVRSSADTNRPRVISDELLSAAVKGYELREKFDETSRVDCSVIFPYPYLIGSSGLYISLTDVFS